MHLQFTPYLLPLLLSAIGSAALAIFAWRHRQITGTISFVWLMLLVAEWSLGNVLELGSTDLAAKLFWSNVEYFGIAFTPVAWFILAARYTGRDEWLTRRTYVLLSIIPILTIFLVWTNDWHGLMRTDIRLDTSGPFSVVAKNYGVWFWIHTAYSYLLNFLGAFLLIQKMTWGSGLYRGQIVALLITVLAPWIGNLAYLSKLSPIPRLDLTPVSFAISGLALAWAIFRSALLDIVPVARDNIIENMDDGVMVFDAQDRVVDINPAAQQMLNRSASEAIGQKVAQIFSARIDLVENYHRTSYLHAEFLHGEGEAQRAFEVHASPLRDRSQRSMGHLVTIRDITQHHQMEREIRESEERFRRLSDAAFEGIAIHDLGKILDVNHAFAATFGYEQAQIIGMHIRELVAAESHERLDQLILSGSDIPREILGLRQDRTTFPAEIVDKAVYNQARSARVLVVRDLTDRKRAEQARYESELLERLRNVLANSPDAVFVFDLAVRKAILLNRDEFCSYAKSELEEPQAILNVIHPDDAKLLGVLWRQFMAPAVDKIDPIECRVRKKDGEWEWIQGRATIIERNPNGIPKQILFTLTTITERKQTEERLKYLSTHDALTGLYNRAFFEEELAKIARGRQFPVSIVMADVNGLKKINDTLGHAAGDDALRRVAQALSSAFRVEDIVARIGGDEFAVLLLRTDAAAAEVALTRIRSHIAQLNTERTQTPIYLSMGAGTAEKGDALSNAFKEADARMYVDKSSTREHSL